MSNLAETRARIAGMGELLDIVGAMRSLAAMRMQEALGRLDGIRSYAGAMADAIADAALLLPPDGHGSTAGSRALVVCTAEHGFVGGFNERLVSAALAALAPRDLLVVLGTRGALLAEEKGRPADFDLPMATRCAAVPDMVNRLSAELYRRIAGGTLGAVAVMFARYRPGAPAAIETRRLLPLDPALLRPRRAAQPPLHNLPPAVLHERLVAEHVFALLTEAAVESLASENAARFAAMDAARDNVGQRLELLRREAREARQSEITTELIELVTGAAALGGA